MNLFNALKPILIALGTMIATNLAVQFAFFASVANAVAAAIGPLVAAFMNLVAVVVNVVAAIVAVLMGDFSGAMTYWNAATQASIDFFKNIWNTLVVFITTFATTFVTIIQSMASAVGINLSTLGTSIVAFFQGLWQTIVQLVTSLANGVKAAFSMLASGAVSTFNSMRASVVSAMNAIRSGITAALNAIRSAFTSAWNAMKSIATSAINAIRSAVTSGLNALRSVVSSVMNAIANVFRSTWNSIKSFLSSINLSSIGRNIMQGLLNGISSMAGAIVSKVQSIGSSIKSAFTGLMKIHSPSRVFLEYGINTVEGYNIGIDRTLPDLTRQVNTMAQVAMAPMSSAASYTPERSGTAASSYTTNSVTISPNVQITVEGGEGSNVRKQVSDGISDVFDYLRVMYDPEVEY